MTQELLDKALYIRKKIYDMRVIIRSLRELLKEIHENKMAKLNTFNDLKLALDRHSHDIDPETQGRMVSVMYEVIEDVLSKIIIVNEKIVNKTKKDFEAL